METFKFYLITCCLILPQFVSNWRLETWHFADLETWFTVYFLKILNTILIELKIYLKMLVTCSLIRLLLRSFTDIWKDRQCLMFYSLPSFPELLGHLCGVLAEILSLPYVFKPTLQSVWDRATEFWTVRCGKSDKCDFQIQQ